MSVGGGSSSSESEASSRTSTPEELEAYFASLSALSGGRLGSWAVEGTDPTHYNALTQAELQAIGGAGATRQSALDTSYANQTDQINTDSSLTYAQNTQANQQATENYMTQQDAINQEVEAAMTGLASQEAMRQYQADLANAQLTAQDLALLSQIYYGGKGQYSTSSSDSGSWDANADVNFLF